MKARSINEKLYDSLMHVKEQIKGKKEDQSLGEKRSAEIKNKDPVSPSYLRISQRPDQTECM
jgi:hypothetical protein